MNINIGDYYQVWWNTGKIDEEGWNSARVLDIKPYTGKFKNLFNIILTLGSIRFSDV